MARYKHIDTSPRFLAVDLEARLLPGTFEHALDHLLDRGEDLQAPFSFPIAPPTRPNTRPTRLSLSSNSAEIC